MKAWPFSALLARAYRLAIEKSEDYDFSTPALRRGFRARLMERFPGFREGFYSRAVLELWRFDLVSIKLYRDPAIRSYELVLEKLRRRCPGFLAEQYRHRLGRSMCHNYNAGLEILNRISRPA